MDDFERDLVKQIMDSVNKIGKKHNLDFYSALIDNESSETVMATKDKISAKSYFFQGIGIRVLYKKKQGYVFTQKTDKKSLQAAFEKAIKIAKFNTKTEIWQGKPIKREYLYKDNSPDLETKTKRIKETIKVIPDRKKEKVDIENNFRQTISRRGFVSSEGRWIYQEIPYSSFGSKVVLLEKRKELGIAKVGKQKGFEIEKVFDDKVIKAYKVAKKLQNAIIPKGGSFNVITDGVLTSVLIHEALGHASESDLVHQQDSCLKGKLNQRLSDKEITVYDDPTKKHAWGSYYFDDEGIKGRRVAILKKGILNEFLNNRYTAKIFNTKPNGHGRSQDASFLPLVRMSNTYIKKGDFGFKEMLESVKNGYYLKGSLGGQVNTLEGDFVFNSYYGYEIKNGKLGRPIKNVSLSSNILFVLKNLIGIGKRYEEDFPGTCGKGGQGVPVSGDNPKVAIRNVMLGGK